MTTRSDVNVNMEALHSQHCHKDNVNHVAIYCSAVSIYFGMCLE